MTRATNIKALICLLLSAGIFAAQTPGQTTPQDQPEVLRVFTELVQTDVMVFDKGGKFVKGLTRENFELKIDGKPKPIEFFETVTAGSINEESLIQAARGATSGLNSAASRPLDRGRSVFFFVDDLHLDLAGVKESKKVITHFLESEIGQNDEAAIASTSGQIGFLQQLTDNRSVLRAALERLKYRPYLVADTFDPRMSEYHALMVDGGDIDLFDYFVVETMRRNPGLQRGHAEIQVRSRARGILQQGAVATTNTLNGLEGLVRSVNKQPGRKLVFFISGGFFLDTRNSDSMERLRRITSAAARNGVVIYSMDARGLAVTSADASQPAMFDPTGRLQRAAGGELHASQDLMNALAKDTGGRTVFNTNALTPGLDRALKETSTYYLLAWKPEQQIEARKFRRIEVRVTGRPELSVQVRRGYFDIEPEQPVAKGKKQEPKPSEKSSVHELRKVMAEAYPNRDLPVSLGLHYIYVPPKGVLLSAALEMPSEPLSFSMVDGKRTAIVNVAGSFYNDRGQVGAFFNNQVKIEASPDGTSNGGREWIYNYNLYLKPGLYQVRVGARDEKTGRAGSAHGWVEIPDLSAGQFSLSSLLVGSREIAPVSDASMEGGRMGAVNLSVGRRFSREEYLRFVIFVYNAALSPNDSKPDLAVQVQVVRDQQPVVTAPLRKIATEGIDDPKRVPYAAEISLKGLPSGRYQLQLSVVDRISKRSSSQQTRFDIK